MFLKLDNDAGIVANCDNYKEWSYSYLSQNY